MSCNHCHVAVDKAGVPDMTKAYAGGLSLTMPMLGTGTLFTPNITSDKTTGIGSWTEEQVETAIKTMTRPNGKLIQGPMMFLQAGWSQITDGDLKAVATYVHQIPPITNKVPISTFVARAMPAGGPAMPPAKN
jgi:hypothetical protein